MMHYDPALMYFIAESTLNTNTKEHLSLLKK